jgi:hypothetical protein
MTQETWASFRSAGLWLGRSTALLLFLFWGAFFAEHVLEWFLQPGAWPPAFVWIAQIFHLGMLVGLALMFRRDKLGALVTVVATAGFAATIADLDVLEVALMNLVPIACFSISWLTSGSPPAVPLRGTPAR